MKIEPFEISVSDEDLDYLHARLINARWVEDFANDDWRYGANGAYLKDLVAYWRDSYDWRAREKEMNRIANFRTVIDDVPIHFVHERGKGPNPIPLILSHGWPWAYWDYQKIIGPLTDPAAHGGDPADAFDLIIPSLPGYVFSSPLRKPGISFVETADLWAKLMSGLGYDRFAAGGGDWGSMVTQQIGHKYAERMIGIYLHFLVPLDCLQGEAKLGLAISLEDYGPGEEHWRAKTAQTVANETGHIGIQSTKPQSIAYALNDFPIGIAAWIIDKHRNLSDCKGDLSTRFTKDDLIDTVMLYWLTGTIGTAARYYYEAQHHPWAPSHHNMPVIAAPTGVSVFEQDAALQPRRWAERYCNLKQWRVHKSGGHYAPMEEPAAVLEDIRAFYRQLR